MRVVRISLVLIATGLWTAPSSAQIGAAPRCLHSSGESRIQQQRREEAIDAADMINRALMRMRRDTGYPTWEALAKSPWIASLLAMSGPVGDLARKMQWGTDQPLPGWSLHYVAAQDAYAFSLTDMRDPCQLTLATNNTGVVIEGRPADSRGQLRVVPLDSSH